MRKKKKGCIRKVKFSFSKDGKMMSTIEVELKSGKIVSETYLIGLSLAKTNDTAS